MKNVLTAIFNLLASVNPLWAAAFTLVTTGVAAFTFVNSMFHSLFARIDALVVTWAGGTVDFSPLGLLNYFFPLDTFCTLATAYLGLVVACAGIRIVKSFVPTMA